VDRQRVQGSHKAERMNKAQIEIRNLQSKNRPFFKRIAFTRLQRVLLVVRGLMKKILVLLLVLMLVPQLLAQKKLYLEEIRKSAEKGWRDNPEIIERWKRTYKPSILWGYDAPGNPIYLASTLAFLYTETRDRVYAERAAELLASYSDFRDILPKGYAATRAEYAGGVPSLANFFYLPPYVRAYLRIRDSDTLSPTSRQKIEKEIAGSVDFIFHFPEWGAHNRAMLRAESLAYACLAMPLHPHAKKWKQMAEAIASDSLMHWEIEDTSLYSPVWLHALFSYAEVANRADLYTSPVMRYCLEHFVKLIAPSGTVPDYGDAYWNSASGSLRFVAIFEKGAAACKNPQMKWAAQSVLNSVKGRSDLLGVADAYSLTDAYRWADESIRPSPPTSLSQEVLEDVVGKKIVFRNGWDPASMYCLLNYRDEGDGAWSEREYLRQTISVEEEKMHHGHADENSIVLLMNKGSVLLHDGGYRSDLPSGQYGAWRQDYFHNRIVVRKNKRDKSQSLLEFVRNSGAYRSVRTRKIDFLNLKDVDMSRTRVTDDNLGYQWDRVITYVRDPGYFIVIDGIKALSSDYFTFANLWHAGTIIDKGEHFFDVATDSVPGFQFPNTQSLLIFFPETYAKTEGAEPINRHSQEERAIFQTVSSHYKAGDMELFLTVLAPHDRSVKASALLPLFKLLKTSEPYKSVGLEITRGDQRSYLCVKLDLAAEVARENIRPRYLYEMGKIRYGELESDAHFLFATLDNRAVNYSAVNVLKVLFRNTQLMEALPNTHGLQLDGAPDRVGFSKWRYWEDSIPLP
jgi:hypothetical protein